MKYNVISQTLAQKLICENGPYKLVGANKLLCGFKALAVENYNES